jgi:hypothetical protein
MAERTLMLRRYLLEEGGGDAFIAWWTAHIPALREAAGFTIEWAYLDRQQHTFTWAISYPGDIPDFKAADARYVANPDRDAALAVAPPLRDVSVGFPQRVR